MRLKQEGSNGSTTRLVLGCVKACCCASLFYLRCLHKMLLLYSICSGVAVLIHIYWSRYEVSVMTVREEEQCSDSRGH